MERYNLYKKLKDAGFPQGGSGSYMVDPNSNESVYIPQPSEIYTQYLADPSSWTEMGDAMATVWLKQHGYDTTTEGV